MGTRWLRITRRRQQPGSTMGQHTKSLLVEHRGRKNRSATAHPTNEYVTLPPINQANIYMNTANLILTHSNPRLPRPNATLRPHNRSQQPQHETPLAPKYIRPPQLPLPSPLPSASLEPASRERRAQEAGPRCPPPSQRSDDDQHNHDDGGTAETQHVRAPSTQDGNARPVPVQSERTGDFGRGAEEAAEEGGCDAEATGGEAGAASSEARATERTCTRAICCSHESVSSSSSYASSDECRR